MDTRNGSSSEKTNSGQSSTLIRRSKTWCSERLLSLFDEQVSEELSVSAGELLRRRRVVDFMIQPGRVTAKVFNEMSQPARLEILVRQTASNEWQKIFSSLARQAYFPAMLLSGLLPPETEEIFEAAGTSLFPKNPSQLDITFKGQKITELSREALAVLYRFCDKLDEDPLSLLLWLGCGREEILLEIRKQRSLLRGKLDPASFIGSIPEAFEPAPPLISTMDYFWSSGRTLTELSYNIKADELPASLLKWLDPPPLGGLEDSVDILLEQAYEKVARLAQGFGLGL